MTADSIVQSPNDPSVRRAAGCVRLSGAMLTLLTIGLMMAGVVYTGFGFYQLVYGVGNIPAIDLKKRWLEHRYFWKRQNPFDVLAASQGKPTDPTRNAAVDPDLGPHVEPGYPPWSFPTGMLLIPPTSLGTARLYFAVLNLLALAGIAWWAFRVGARSSGDQVWDVRHGWLFAAGATAMTANFFCLSAGQYSILVNALLVAALISHKQGWDVAAGLALGMAMIKPQIAALFGLAFLVKGRWKTVATAAVFLVAASLIASWQVHTSVVELIRQMLSVGQRWLTKGSGYDASIFLVQHVGLDAKLVVPWCAAIGIAGALALMTLWRRASVLLLFAIAAVVGRFWAYHGIYDNTMLVFLLIALVRSWCRHPPNWIATAVLCLVSLTLWNPLTFYLHGQLFVQIPHMVIWVLGLIVLLNAEPFSADQVLYSDASPIAPG